jgi:hypothetical protein
MADILETAMLVCFGISWPIALIKSIKVGSAKSTSVQFIILILLGYFAGISAKIVDHNYSYVFFFYILNIISVSGNLVVYFINRQKDKKRAI